MSRGRALPLFKLFQIRGDRDAILQLLLDHWLNLLVSVIVLFALSVRLRSVLTQDPFPLNAHWLLSLLYSGLLLRSPLNFLILYLTACCALSDDLLRAIRRLQDHLIHGLL